MNRLARLDRLVRNVQGLHPDPGAVIAAMERFRATGELPMDIPLAHAVTEWAETGAPESIEGAGSLEALICVHVESPSHVRPPIDAVMHGLYEDAVFGDETERDLARELLRILARAGHDPSKPLWLKFGWPQPVMTCNSVALTLAGFPRSFVRPEHSNRSAWLAKKLFAYGNANCATEDRFHALLHAEDTFYETGKLPDDPGMLTVALWNTELAAYHQLWSIGQQQPRLLESLHAYWAATVRERPRALAAVRYAVLSGPESIDPEAAGSTDELRKHLRHLVKLATEAAEQMA